MGCGGLGKAILVVVNIVFFIGGGLLLAVGVIAKFKEDLLDEIFAHIPGDVPIWEDITKLVDIRELIDNAAIALMVVGGVIFVIAFCGCCGALKDSKPLLIAYGTIVFVLLGAKIALVIYYYANPDSVDNAVQELLVKSVHKYDQLGFNNKYDSTTNTWGLSLGTDPTSLGWDAIQVTVGCCGVYNYTDYLAPNANFNGTFIYPTGTGADDFIPWQIDFPPSCCKVNSTDFPDNIEVNDVDKCLNGTMFEKYSNAGIGCYMAVKDMVREFWNIMIYVGAAVAAVELLCIMAACCICCDGDGKK